MRYIAAISMATITTNIANAFTIFSARNVSSKIKAIESNERKTPLRNAVPKGIGLDNALGIHIFNNVNSPTNEENKVTKNNNLIKNGEVFGSAPKRIAPSEIPESKVNTNNNALYITSLYIIANAIQGKTNKKWPLIRPL